MYQHSNAASGAMACVSTSWREGSITTKSFRTGQRSQQDVTLTDTGPMIRLLAEKTWAASRNDPRIARTVVLKLKPSEFKILTRSHTPSAPPTSC
jgi:DNA polymerase IV